MATERFWETKTLDAFTPAEWEAVCDGCARCCLVKFEEEDGSTEYTRVVCRYLDQQRCRCSRYPERHELVPDCVELDADAARAFDWLPETCAYRRLANGLGLAWWHPLVSGDPETIHTAGISVRGRVLSEEFVHPEGYDEHVIRWVYDGPDGDRDPDADPDTDLDQAEEEH